MKFKLEFIYLILLPTILLLNTVCKTSLIKEPKSQISTKNTITTTNTPTEQILEIGNFEVYSNVLTSLVYGADTSDSKDVFEFISGYEWLTIKKETVVPESLDEIKSLPNLPEDLINDFIEKNNSREKLEDGYDVKIQHNVISQNGSLESFFSQQKKKQPRLKAIIGLSRVGFNSNRTQSLTYVEYFNLEKQLQKKYCLITWKRDGIVFWDENIKWF
jgi:hypothetical protein